MKTVRANAFVGWLVVVFAWSASADTVWYAKRAVNVRTSPSISGEARFTIGVNTRVVRDQLQGDWWHLRAPVNGWAPHDAFSSKLNWYAGGFGGRYVARMVRVRTGPGAGEDSRGTLTLNSAVFFDATVWKGDGDRWVHATYPLMGWVAADALSGHPFWAPCHVGSRYAKATLNVRTGPGVRYKMISRIGKDARVEVDAYLTSGWAHLKSPHVGWVYGHNLTTQAPVVALRPNRRGFVNCPASGAGFYEYEPADRRWGTPRLVNGLIALGRRWNDGYPGVRGRRLSYGDISRPYGGYFPPHQSHQQGIDVDSRMISTSGNAEPMTIWSGNYSRYFTTKYIYLQREVWGGGIMLLNNDGHLPYVRYCAGHDNHIHTRTY